MHALRIPDAAQQIDHASRGMQRTEVQQLARSHQAKALQRHLTLVVPIRVALLAVGLQPDVLTHVHRDQLFAHLTAEIRVQMRVKIHDHSSITSTL